MRVLKAVPDRDNSDVVYFLVDNHGDLLVMKAIFKLFEWQLNHHDVHSWDGIHIFQTSPHFKGKLEFDVFSAEQMPDDLREAYEKAQSERQRRVGHTPLLEGPNSP
jgi:hypothetical protein